MLMTFFFQMRIDYEHHSNTHQFHEKIAGFSIKKKLGTTPHWLKQYLDDEKDDYVVDDLVIWLVCTYLPKKSFFF